jgi:hypothetical protein
VTEPPPNAERFKGAEVEDWIGIGVAEMQERAEVEPPATREGRCQSGPPAGS